MKLLPIFAFVAVGLAGLKAVSERAVRRYEHLALEEVVPDGRTVQVKGHPIHYHEAGTGEPVVLLHGLGASSYSYRFLVPALSDSYRIIALDLPGFGFSTREAEDMSIAGQVAYLRAFLDTLGIEKAILVGHSMGGAIAMAFVTEHAERVKALVLVSPATAGQLGRMRYLAPVLRPFVPLFAWAVLYNPPLRRRWLSLAVHDPRFLTPELIRRYGLPAHVRGNVGALQRWLMDRRRDRELRPEAIAAPTLIVWGASDRLLRPSGGERLQGQIRGSRLVVVPEAGHLVLEERPDAVNPLILDFLHEVTGRKEEHPVADQAPAPPPQA